MKLKHIYLLVKWYTKLMSKYTYNKDSNQWFCDLGITVEKKKEIRRSDEENSGA